MDRFYFSTQQRYELMKRFELNSFEFDLIIAVFTLKDGGSEDLFNEWLAVNGEDLASTTIKALQARGILSEITMPLRDVEISGEFADKILCSSEVMFNELYNIYPEAMNVNGRVMSLRNTYGNGGWATIDDVASFYGQRIQYNAETHRNILKMIEEAKGKELLNMGIIKFLRGEEWRNLEVFEEK